MPITAVIAIACSTRVTTALAIGATVGILKARPGSLREIRQYLNDLFALLPQTRIVEDHEQLPP